jgi:hypothetical protein
MKQTNQFIDKFKFLTTATVKADDLRRSINQYLAKSLPSRILSKVNIFELTLATLQDIFHLNMFYVEDSLIENNIAVAQNPLSVRGLAQLSGHSATRSISSYGVLEFRLKPDISALTPTIIFDSTIIRCKANQLKYTLNSATKTVNSDNESITLDFIEGYFKTQTIVVDSDIARYIAHIDDSMIIENSNISVAINGIKFKQFAGLYDMAADDNGYLIRNGIANQIDIVFGDSVYGRKLNVGDTIEITYLITNGSLGNIESVADSVTFEVLSGTYDANGDEISATDNIDIKYVSGFALGSDGEHIETTRLFAGYNSRSMVFARPENIKAFLGKLSILSYIDVWTESDNLTFNILALSNVKNKITSYSDYLSMPTSSLMLSTLQKNAIYEYINTSESQLTSSELVFRDPIFDRYAIFVYIDATYTDASVFKSTIYDAISELMLNETFADVDLNADAMITKSSIVNAIYDLPDVKRVAINIFGEVNEKARIDGYYKTYTEINNGSAKNLVEQIITVLPTDNPNLGFSDIGDIVTASKYNIPLIRSGFQKYSSDGNHLLLDKPIYIFHSINNIWQEL